MARGGVRALERKTKTRRCVLTGASITPRSPALRFVLNPDGDLTVDLTGKLPGRGAWLMAGAEHLEAAVKKGAFKKAFKADVSLPPDMTARAYSGFILEQLKIAALARLGLLRKGRGLVTGFEKCRKTVKSEQDTNLCAAYIVASNAGTDGREKMEKLLAKNHVLKQISQLEPSVPHENGSPPAAAKTTKPALPVIDLFEGDELSRAVGEENFIHGIIIHRAAAKGLIRESLRLSRFL